MELQEINGMAWDFLAKSTKPLTLEKISVELGLQLMPLQTSLAQLRQLGLVTMHSTQAAPVYGAVVKLDALKWAQAVSAGVPLSALETHAKLSTEKRNEAMRLSASGAVEKEEQKRKRAKEKKRDELLYGRAASKAAGSDIAQMLKDAEDALSRAKAGGDPQSQLTAKLLEQANDKIKSAYNDLIRSLERR